MQKYEQDMKTIRQQMSSMFTMLEKLRDQEDINTVASTLYKSGQLKINHLGNGDDGRVGYATLDGASHNS